MPPFPVLNNSPEAAAMDRREKPRLLGWVSDERHVAVPGVHVQIDREGELAAAVRSTARGAVLAAIEPGRYRVTLNAAGFSGKSSLCDLHPERPLQFRLLSDRLAGYAWPLWARAGERVEFRVHSSRPYRLSLWRHGLRAEQVKLIGWFDEHGPGATLQITPDGDYTGLGAGWNRTGWGSPHHTQFVQVPQPSGLYYFHAEDEQGGYFTFPLVAAPAEPRAPIAVLAASNTWNAYNNWGGRSHYINAAGLPAEPCVYSRQDLLRYSGDGSFREWGHPDSAYLPLSFERPQPHNSVRRGEQPEDPIRGRQQCHLAPAEWRLLAWLEREGYEYDYYAEAQLHSGELDLDSYRLLVLPPHPEYWSRTMFDRVYDWVYRRGGRLAYLGGNGLNCEVELDEAAGTMRCLSELRSTGGSLGSTGASGELLESRMHRSHRSEAGLLGVVCTDAGIMTAAPYRVLAAGHPLFRGTGLRRGDLFGEASLHERCSGGASGHETDKLSPSSPEGVQHLAKGVNPEEGGADLVCFETGGGGAVFSTGSITYCASLLVDPVLSRITRNAFDWLLGEPG